MALMLLSLVAVPATSLALIATASGFRSLPAPRPDILLGKNLALIPIAVALAGVPSVVLAILFPLRIDHLLTVPLLWLSMLFVFFVLTNLLSIFAPAAIAPGSLKPQQTKGLFILLQIVFVFVLPVALSVTLIPFGVEVLLANQDIVGGWPVCLASWPWSAPHWAASTDWRWAGRAGSCRAGAEDLEPATVKAE